jgi:putative ABC transport system permease protein
VAVSVGEALRLALRRLRSNKLRTGLTTLGIIIGAASLVALLAVGQGASRRLTSRIASLGTNLLSVQAGATFQGGIRGAAGSASTLTTDDADALRGIRGVAAVAPELPVTGALVVAGRRNTTTQVTGTTPEEARVRAYDLAAGTFLSALEVRAGLRVAVLGATTTADLGLSPEGAVGSTIQIDAIPFQVVGVTQPKGGGFGNPDDVVFVPITAVQRRLTGTSSLRAIGVSVATTDDIPVVSLQAQTLLRQRHRLGASDSNDFLIANQAQLLQVASDQATVIRNFLIGIAAIALVVGGIGIANIMLVAVRERTREIGIRKAIGARRRDLSRQFLVEAVTVSLAGGALGALIGVLAAGLVGRAVNVQAAPSWLGVTLAFASSALVGMVAGWWPARQAAQLDPVVALRYE